MANFQENKESLIAFLKTQSSPFNSFNYELSGISTIIDLLALSEYKTEQATNVLLNESFFSSSERLNSLYSHAKKTTYIPRGVVAATAKITLNISATDSNNIPTDTTIIIPKFSEISSTDSRKFYTSDTYLLNRVGDIFSAEVIAIEGQKIIELFKVDNSIIHQTYIISSENCERNSIQVLVDGNLYVQVDSKNVLSLDGNSNIYFIEKSFDGKFLIFFGNNTLGNLPSSGQRVEIQYISSSGPDGNSATFLNSNIDFDVTGWTILLTSAEVSFGGDNSEDIESLRLGISTSLHTTTLLSSPDDIKSYILSEFPSVSTVSSYYTSGVIFIVLPAHYESGFKELIKSQLLNLMIPTLRIEFINPVDVYIDLEVYAIVTNPLFDSRTSINSAIVAYSANINRFNSTFSVSELSKLICQGDSNIESVSIKVSVKSTQDFNFLVTDLTTESGVFSAKPVESFISFDNNEIPTIRNSTIKIK